ncbi:MAG: hypothetical protein HC867_00675 [Bacteroidia bacterium]|nr:hypothetical protein [Bacteroidia bacterium]
MDTDEIRRKIWRIADGIPFKLDNMTIRTTDSGKLIVTGWTDTINFKNISKEKILQELEELKSSFSELSKSFNELNDIVKGNNLTIEYHMAYDDAGKVGIGLCSELEGKINWYIS